MSGRTECTCIAAVPAQRVPRTLFLPARRCICAGHRRTWSACGRRASQWCSRHATLRSPDVVPSWTDGVTSSGMHGSCARRMPQRTGNVSCSVYHVPSAAAGHVRLGGHGIGGRASGVERVLIKLHKLLCDCQAVDLWVGKAHLTL